MARGPTRPLSLAPMMDRTDRHFRWLMRRISRRVLLYTEMVPARAMLAGRAGEALAFDPSQTPIAVQLGGSDPGRLAACSKRAEDLGFDEVNLNCGCPSSRVQEGAFGAVLMLDPHRVADTVDAMRAATGLPVTVKCRIGVDDHDSFEALLDFVDAVATAGADRLIVHARKAWLQGLSPKQNRTVPPLRHDIVHRLKIERPDLRIETNGGVQTLAEAVAHLEHVDGAMIGRAAYDDPMILADADNILFGDAGPAPTRAEIGMALHAYARRHVAGGGRLHDVTRHALGLWHGVPGGRRARGLLSGGAGGRSVAGLDAATACLGAAQHDAEAALLPGL